MVGSICTDGPRALAKAFASANDELATGGAATARHGQRGGDPKDRRTRLTASGGFAVAPTLGADFVGISTSLDANGYSNGR
jgi:hypothetical protein